MKRALIVVALCAGCVAQYAVETRHDEPRLKTPTWRVVVDMGLMLAAGAVAVVAPEGPHWVGFGAGLGVWAADTGAEVATGRKD